MTTPDADSTVLASADPAQPIPPVELPIPKSAKNKKIQVSPAVLEAAKKSSEELLRDLRTAPEGLT